LCFIWLVTRHIFFNRQACTTEKIGEVEFLDVNHYATTEDDFGFVTEDFVKPTVEEREFV